MIELENDFEEENNPSFFSNVQMLAYELQSKGVWVFAGIECLHLARRGVNIKCFTDLGGDEHTVVAVTDPDLNIIFETVQSEFETLRDFIISKLGLSNELRSTTY